MISPIIAAGISIILFPIFLIIDFSDLGLVVRGSYYLIGLFVFAVMLFKVILNFFDYYKEKYEA
jgi:hypothetical protein